jgi:hypothetical protein
MTEPSSEAAATAQQRSFWIAVICGAVILTIGIGARQSFGIFQKPIAADLKVFRIALVRRGPSLPAASFTSSAFS